MNDPRSHRRYTDLAKQHIAALANTVVHCALCGQPVNMYAPRTTDAGPTIEHRVPVRRLRKLAHDEQDLLDLVCDTELWGVAHRRCNSNQGGIAAAHISTKSRDW